MPRQIKPAKKRPGAARPIGASALVVGTAGALAGIAGMPLYCVALGTGSVLLFELEYALLRRADRRPTSELEIQERLHHRQPSEE